ncbi:hypothetical protein VTI28DRAFT_1614 [Corynascus sepedonium]
MKSFAIAMAFLAPLIKAQGEDEPGTASTTPTPSLPTAPACASVTATREVCTTCPVPACLQLATITQSCGCPTPVPTVYLDFPCSSGCGGIWCSTSYAIVTAEGCVTDGPAPTDSLDPTDTSGPTDDPAPTSDWSSTTRAPNGTVTTHSPTATSSIATGAAGRLRVPFLLW